MLLKGVCDYVCSYVLLFMKFILKTIIEAWLLGLFYRLDCACGIGETSTFAAHKGSTTKQGVK